MRAVWAALLIGCRPPIPAAAPADLETGRFFLAHTNDLHTHFRPNRADWLPGAPSIGGFEAIDAHLTATRERVGEDALLYLDGGDLLSGTPLMEFEVHGARGGAMLDFLDTVGADAWVLGNHELDQGWDNAAALVKASPMPVLTANVRNSAAQDQPGFPGARRRLILEANGVKVGVFGLTTMSLGRLASAETMSHLAVLPAAEVAAEEVAALEPHVDLVVALTHSGIESDRGLAQSVPGIDLIVGGHSHTAVDPPEKVGDTWIVQAGSYARQLGMLDLRVSDGKIEALDGQLIDLLPDELPRAPRAEVQTLVREWSEKLDARFDVPIGEATARLGRRGGADSPLGRWAGDVLRAHTGADVGIYNRGGLRADIAAGPVTLGDLYEVFPFGNEVVVFEASGVQLANMAVRALLLYENREYQPLEFGGLRLTWRLRMGAPEVVGLTVGGQRVEPDRVYTVATNSYVAEQWEHHLTFEPQGLQESGERVLDVMAAAARRGPIAPPPDARIVRVGR